MSAPRFLPLALVVAVLASAAACPPRKDDPVAPAPAPDAGAAPAAGLFAPPGPGRRALVLYTSSVQGYVEPCGCTAEPLGGIARFAAAVEEARRAWGERVLVLDAGDLLFEKLDDTKPADLCQTEARVDVLLDAYAKNGLAATVLGPLDDVRGASFRDRRLAQRGIVTVGVGLPRALVDGATHMPSMLKVVGDVKIGVVGVRLDAPQALGAQRAALEAEVKKLLGQGAEAIVLLAQSPRELTRALATDLEGVDVVLQGRAPGEVPVAPERLGAKGPVLVASAHQAQHLGVVELALEGRVAGAPLALDDREAELARRKKVLDVRIAELAAQVTAATDDARKQFLQQRVAAAEAERASLRADAQPAPAGAHMVARSIALQRGMPEEPAAAAALAGYQDAVPTLVAQCEANAQCPEPAPGASTYVGAATCKACHVAAWTFWQQQTVTRQARAKDGKMVERVVGHARAWQSLVEDKKQSDRTCVGCHSVGFAEPGGACKTSDIVSRGLEGVQCESCHGPGSAHVATTDKKLITRQTTEQTCRACHQVPHIETTASFVFTEKLKHVLGPGHGQPVAGAGGGGG